MKIPFYIVAVFFYLNVNTIFLTDYQTYNNILSIIESDSISTISISVVGDLMCHSPQYEYARVDKDSFDFKTVFREVISLLSQADFAFGNLETVTAGKEMGGYSGYPKFNTPSTYITALADAGFDLLVTSNNHSLDRGEIGVIKTIEQINKNKLAQTGTFLSPRDRDSIRSFNIKGIKFAILSYSYGTNGNPIPRGKDYLINLIKYDLIKKDIEEARLGGNDIVIVNFHFGDEYKREPVQYQKEVVDKTIEMGADIIIGGHPHVIQPINFFKTNNTAIDTGLVAYSMGNFISNQRKRYTDSGMILTIKIAKDFKTGSIKISSVEFIPTWVFKGNINSKKQFLIIPSTTNKDSLWFLNKEDSEKMMQAFEDTRNIVTKYFSNTMLRNIKSD